MEENNLPHPLLHPLLHSIFPSKAIKDLDKYMARPMISFKHHQVTQDLCPQTERI